MADGNRKIMVYTTSVWMLTQHKHIFDDWYDFADYVKQENLAGRVVVVAHWEYVNG